jgi:hypothetical protein
MVVRVKPVQLGADALTGDVILSALGPDGSQAISFFLLLRRQN